MNVKQGDVVLLSVPFSDQSARKTRPAIVISNNHINTTSDDVMLVQMTSVLKEVSYSVFITDENLKEGRLAAPSRIRADKIFTASKTIIQTKIGTVKPKILAAIKQEITKAF